MPIEFSIHAAGEELKFEMRGARDDAGYVQDMLAGWSQVAQICRDQGIRRVMGINALTGRADQLGAFEIARTVSQQFLGTGVRIALVVPGGASALETNRFAETVAVNRGAQVRVFDGEAPARQWLDAQA